VFDISSKNSALQVAYDVARVEHMRFDQGRFYEAVDRRRTEESLSWRQLATRLSLSPSTFSRLSQGKRPDVDTFVKLLAWMKRPASDFVTGSTPSTTEPRRDTVDVIADSLRDDPALSPENSGALEEIVRVAYHRFRSL
jgi:transcriptional regulator with XRE-family HTH domain